MASNQYINKVEFGNETLMDLSSDTILADALLTGYTAHDRSGAPITGSLSTFIPSGSTAAAGLVPAPSTTAGTTAFLCEDGTWKIPVDTTYNVMTGASSSTAGTSGLVPAPAAGDEDKFLAGDGTYKSGGLPMVILSYGSSTWEDFMAAYNNHVIVYCRASSNSNPATGQQLRMAFMAYVAGNATTPTEVEFQYYRSVNAHSATQMGDQVFVYKLTNKGVWSVTTREASIKQITGTGITVAWSSNKVTLTNDVTVSDSLTDTSTTKALSAAKGKELSTNIGDLTTLTTTAQTSAVDAINEVSGTIATIFKRVSHIGVSITLSTAPGFIDYLPSNEIPSGYSLASVKVITTASVNFVYSLSNQDTGINVRGLASASASFTADVEYLFVNNSCIV